MTMTLEINPELRERLQRAAEQKGLEPEGYVVRLLEQTLPRAANQKALDILQSFMEGDEEEQRETGEFLMRALDEDRSSYRKLSE